MSTRSLVQVSLAAAGLCAIAQTGCLAPPNVCRGDPGGPTPSADAVCDHLAAMSCLAGPIPEYLDGGPETGVIEVPFDAMGTDLPSLHARECRAGYASFRAMLGADRFDALARCYAAARSCEEVEACNRGCDLASTDAAVMDAPFDAGVMDAPFDAAMNDAPFDAGVTDAPDDAGAMDASFDAGAMDAPLDAHVFFDAPTEDDAPFTGG